MKSRSTKNQLELMVYNIKTALDMEDPNMGSVNRLVNQLDDYIQDLPDDERLYEDIDAHSDLLIKSLVKKHASRSLSIKDAVNAALKDNASIDRAKLSAAMEDHYDKMMGFY